MRKGLISVMALVLVLTSLVQPSRTEASQVDDIIDISQNYIGTPYLWGGTDPNTGFDCSGYLWYIFQQIGITLPRSAQQQYDGGQPISNSELQAGDLVFFENTGSRPGVTHSGLYMGNGNMIHTSASQGVIITPMSNSYWAPRYVGAKRYIQQPTEPNVDVHMLSGADRFQTSVEVSKQMYPNGFPTNHSDKTVIIATGSEAADALSAGPLAAEYGDAPILLTRSDRLPSTLASEINRLGADRAVIIGGENAISPNVEANLMNTNISQVERISGSNRLETNQLINEQLTNVDGYFVASGMDFPDALAAAPIAAGENFGIILTNGSLRDGGAALLNGQDAFIVGGEAAVSSQIEAQVQAAAASTTRLAGANRYGTNAALLQYFYGSGLTTDAVVLTTGGDFPDALAAAPLAAAADLPLALAGSSLSNEVGSYFNGSGAGSLYVIGGQLSDNVINDMRYAVE
ncbi:cell wall-binding repeat-containing protein [Alteribacter lacisalsi]|nr:cell wall-binding repeat-containing protein [Alteribacter lacisalsi]